MSREQSNFVRWFDTLSISDIPIVGGKNASLGEMVRGLRPKGIAIPDGFATTAFAYREYLKANALPERIDTHIKKWAKGAETLANAGTAIRKLILDGEFPEDLREAILTAYAKLSKRYQKHDVDVAVRSSATAEDLPDASFAGQQESFLNVQGERDVLDACRRCFASLFTDRAIVYRKEKGFDYHKIALSIGVQKMVRSDKAASGVIFTIDTETGFPNAVIINSSWGLGENVVKGFVTPDQFTLFKPHIGAAGISPIIERKLGDKAHKLVYSRGSTAATKNIPTPAWQRNSFSLSDEDVMKLGCWAVAIEEHYHKPMDIEFAKDGESGDLFIVQARPETVQSRAAGGSMKTFSLKEKGKILLSGISIGEQIAAGKVCRVLNAHEIDKVEPGSILVTEMTDPDWVPIMKKVAGIVTDAGGRTCHAAIVSRELGIPAIVGTGHATQVLKPHAQVTLSCAEGDTGHVYEGALKFEATEIDLTKVPRTSTNIMMNIASPEEAFRWWRLPAKGIGLARMEFIISNLIKVHPMALIHPDRVDVPTRATIHELTRNYESPQEYFVDQLAMGISKIAASQAPEPVIVRMSDFKSNEYANLIGGTFFEMPEENPMIGFRGASRYYSPHYQEGFALECRAIKRVREKLGFANVIVMIPFCRTLREADLVLKEMERNGLKRGEFGLQVYVMCEIPANVILAEEFAKRFDGFSIGSNDLTQLVLGVDRDSAELATLFDERNDAVKKMISTVIHSAHISGTKVGICGQAPSDYPDFAEFLVKEGIDSISLNPDSVVRTKEHLARAEKAMHAGKPSHSKKSKKETLSFAQ